MMYHGKLLFNLRYFLLLNIKTYNYGWHLYFGKHIFIIDFGHNCLIIDDGVN
jgi:hypothetical protein